MVEYALEAFVDAIGFLAGLMVSFALVPQIYRAHKRKSAKDLSYYWQVILALGVTFQLLYLSHYDLWAAFIPLVGELVLMLYLTGLKIYFQRKNDVPQDKLPLSSKSENDHGDKNGKQGQSEQRPSADPSGKKTVGEPDAGKVSNMV